ncbi:hypothetical protein AAHC03_0218 [Spirometra sp. Aus1]
MRRAARVQVSGHHHVVSAVCASWDGGCGVSPSNLPLPIPLILQASDLACVSSKSGAFRWQADFFDAQYCCRSAGCCASEVDREEKTPQLATNLPVPASRSQRVVCFFSYSAALSRGWLAGFPIGTACTQYVPKMLHRAKIHEEPRSV